MYTPDNDLSCIFHYFDNCPGDILEIGCNSGVTTKKLAERYPERKVFGIDSRNSYLTMHPSQHGECPQNTVGHLARDLPNVSIIDGLSPLHLLDYAEKLKNVRCVFVDGDHSYAGVSADTYWLLGFLPPVDNVILWHDYYDNAPNWCRVKAVVDQLFPIYNIITPANTHLAVLCR